MMNWLGLYVVYNILPHDNVLKVVPYLFICLNDELVFIPLFPYLLDVWELLILLSYRLLWWTTLRPLALYKLRGRFAAFAPYILWNFHFGCFI